MNKKIQKSLSIAVAVTAGTSASAIFVSDIVNNNDSNIESISERAVNNVVISDIEKTNAQIAGQHGSIDSLKLSYDIIWTQTSPKLSKAEFILDGHEDKAIDITQQVKDSVADVQNVKDETIDLSNVQGLQNLAAKIYYAQVKITDDENNEKISDEQGLEICPAPTISNITGKVVNDSSIAASDGKVTDIKVGIASYDPNRVSATFNSKEVVLVPPNTGDIYTIENQEGLKVGTYTLKVTVANSIKPTIKTKDFIISEILNPSINEINGDVTSSNWGEKTGTIENISFSIENYGELSTKPTAILKHESGTSIGAITVNDDGNGNYTIANQTGLKSGTYTLEIYEDDSIIDGGKHEFIISTENDPEINNDNTKAPTVPEGEPAEFTIKSKDVFVEMDKIPQGTKAMFKVLDKSGILISKLETDGNIKGTTITPKLDLVVPVENVAEGFSLVLEIESNGQTKSYDIIDHTVIIENDLSGAAVAAIVVGSLAGATVIGGGAYWYVAKEGKSSLKTTIDSAKAKAKASKKPTDEKPVKKDI